MDDWKKRLAGNANSSVERDRQEGQEREMKNAAEARAEEDNETRRTLQPLIAGLMRSDAQDAAVILKATKVKPVQTSSPPVHMKLHIETKPKTHPPLTKGSFIRGIISRLDGNTEYIVTEEPEESDVPREAWPVRSSGYHYDGGNTKTGSTVGQYMVGEWVGLAADGSLHEFWGEPEAGHWSHHRALPDSALVPIEYINPESADQLSLEEQPVVTNWRGLLGDMCS